MRHGSRLARRIAALAFVALGAPAAAVAQVGIVTQARENFRAAPSGSILAEVVQDASLALGEGREQWREATLEGWVWARSLQREERDGYDLIVSAANGENLRVAPNGRILARLRRGMLLHRVEDAEGWIRVRRTGWIWEPSLRTVESAQPASGAAADSTPVRRVAEVQPSRPPAAPGSRRWATAGASELAVLNSPSGDTLARLNPGAQIEVLAREGEWARVRIEGWTFASALAGTDTSDAVLRDITVQALQEQPDRYRGRFVEWTLQFIALQEAERFRTDFIEGEPYILARGPGDDPGFVYLAVPPERLARIRTLLPLQHMRVLGRVRAARSGLTGAPVLDLLEFRTR